MHLRIGVFGPDPFEALSPFYLDSDDFNVAETQECYCVSNNVPEADCTECGGTGSEEVSYNPNGRFESARISGRFTGFLPVRPGFEDQSWVMPGATPFDEVEVPLDPEVPPLFNMLAGWGVIPPSANVAAPSPAWAPVNGWALQDLALYGRVAHADAATVEAVDLDRLRTRMEREWSRLWREKHLLERPYIPNGYADPRGRTLDEYLAMGPSDPFDVIFNGEWIEHGSWDEFVGFFTSLPTDTILAIADAHI